MTYGRIAAAHGRFSRIRQVAPPSSTPQSASAPYRCCPLLSRFEYIDRRSSPGVCWVRPLSPSKLPLRVWISGPLSNTRVPRIFKGQVKSSGDQGSALDLAGVWSPEFSVCPLKIVGTLLLDRGPDILQRCVMFESSVLVRGQVTIIFVACVCLFVCQFVCLCRVFISRLRSDLDQTRTHVTCPGLVVSPRI